MNVRVPGEGDITAFWVIIGVMVACSWRCSRLFRRRGLALTR